MIDLTREQVEIFADPKRSAVSLICDLQGNVIGNSQHLAIICLKLSDAIGEFMEDAEKAVEKLGKALDK